MKAIHGYHAHIYFDRDCYDQAKQLCKQAGTKFQLRVGRMHQNPVGPHPRGSCQLAFSASVFGQLLPWLIRYRAGLTVLIHTITGDEHLDHTDNALWLGAPEKLDLSKL